MKRTILNIFLGLSVVIVLNGCAIAAIGVVGAAAGTTAVVATDPRPSGTVVTDNTIETKLKLKYSSYDNANIYVSSYNGVVLLTGQIPNSKMKKDIEFNAKVMPGVRKIYDYLETRLPQSFSSKSQDSYITTQIKTKLLTASGINSNSIKVITTNSVVYLLGIVTQKQATDAANIAASISGVTKVVTLFEYVN